MVWKIEFIVVFRWQHACLQILCWFSGVYCSFYSRLQPAAAGCRSDAAIIPIQISSNAQKSNMGLPNSAQMEKIVFHFGYSICKYEYIIIYRTIYITYKTIYIYLLIIYICICICICIMYMLRSDIDSRWNLHQGPSRHPTEHPNAEHPCRAACKPGCHWDSNSLGNQCQYENS